MAAALADTERVRMGGWDRGCHGAGQRDKGAIEIIVGSYMTGSSRDRSERRERETMEGAQQGPRQMPKQHYADACLLVW